MDPANNTTQINVEQEYFDIWRFYISEDRVGVLKEFYKCFKKNERIDLLIDNAGEDKVDYVVRDYPVDRPAMIEITESQVQRDEVVLERALAYAGHICELNCKNELFIRRKGDYYYTEGHHLIPLKYQNDFEHSLDVEANIVSLCPNCHRQLHYGLENEDKLKMLFDKRIERLNRCEINISFEELLRMYGPVSRFSTK